MDERSKLVPGANLSDIDLYEEILYRYDYDTFLEIDESWTIDMLRRAVIRCLQKLQR